MAKSNFFITAAGLNLGLLALSALSYWYTQSNSQQESESEKDSSHPQTSAAGNVSHEANSVCGVCRKEIVSNAITFPCDHEVHGDCFHQVETNGWKCPRCDKKINTE